MILINLLPHREAARKRRREAFYISLGLAALLGGLVAVGIYGWFQAQITNQEAKNNYLQGEIKRLDAQIKDIARLQDEIASLKARQQAVEDLQADRNLPVHLLTEVARQLPTGVYINSLRQDNQTIVLQGVAQSNERVAELLRNLSGGTPWLTRPELIEIVAGSVTLSPRDQRRVANFTVRAQLQRASAVAKAAASAASASASAAAPASAAVAVASGVVRPASAGQPAAATSAPPPVAAAKKN